MLHRARCQASVHSRGAALNVHSTDDAMKIAWKQQVKLIMFNEESVLSFLSVDLLIFFNEVILELV